MSELRLHRHCLMFIDSLNVTFCEQTVNDALKLVNAYNIPVTGAAIMARNVAVETRIRRFHHMRSPDREAPFLYCPETSFILRILHITQH